MKFTIASTIILILSLSACSNSNKSAEPIPAVGQATTEDNPITGLWLIPPDASQGSVNESYSDYFELKDDSMTVYFAFNMSNCYHVFEFPMTKLEGSTYAVDFGQFVDRVGPKEVDFFATDGVLTYSFVDTEDDDEDGNTTETLVETFTKVDNISSVDFNICS